MREQLEGEYRTIGDVAASLTHIEAGYMARRDRRGVFTTAYLEITRSVETAIGAGRFQDPEWTTRYLVAFGNLYRRALFEWEFGDRGAVPKSWRMAFSEAAAGTGLVTQHLLLGINAHINHDLPLALDAIGIDPQRDVRYRDHTHVNEVLAEATTGLRDRVATLYAPILERIDWIGGRLDDELAGFSIVRAREHAWTLATALAATAGRPTERALVERSLDEQAALVARAILSRPTRHPILLRTVRAAERVDGLVRRIGGVLGLGSR